MSKIKSRKFWMAVVSGALVVANEGLGLDLPIEAVMTVAAVAIGYILGQGYVDGKEQENMY
ncbi:hypothetical protein BHU72_12070 [Desulfuribacillus stibiiarsenatis]|uniref:Holin n=1 Tax=Desulfuribacillus stibiiarsenatis TaxID=1390249 RepID=A0A1E5L8B4_9FIRM|nr:hypothetical protein [Desulfuribacillus stibiiarsenatis]OEH86264.1 hypothetical protein BHU72_12070 [Desulfuribacillus stibiiarsenatis]